MRYFTFVVVVVLGTTEFATSGERDIFASLDANSDGQLAGDEVDAQHQKLYRRLLRTADKNDDGQLSEEVFLAGTAPKRPAITVKCPRWLSESFRHAIPTTMAKLRWTRSP